MSKLVPKYTLWESINTAIALGMRALEEIRTLARQPGPRGADGLGFTDMKFVKTGDRNFALRFERGKEVVEHPFSIDCMIYRDVFHDGTVYEPGDTVTWSGSMWVAKEKTGIKPGDGPAWTLAVKRGRDGKDVVSIARDPAALVKIKGGGNGPNHG